MSALRISDKMASTSRTCWPDGKTKRGVSRWVNECECVSEWVNARCLYLDLYSKRRDACVFRAPHNHFLQQVPLVISANRTLIRHRLIDGHVLSCVWSHGSRRARALKRFLNPTGRRTSNLNKINLRVNNNIPFITEKLHLNTVKI